MSNIYSILTRHERQCCGLVAVRPACLSNVGMLWDHGRRFPCALILAKYLKGLSTNSQGISHSVVNTTTGRYMSPDNILSGSLLVAKRTTFLLPLSLVLMLLFLFSLAFVLWFFLHFHVRCSALATARPFGRYVCFFLYNCLLIRHCLFRFTAIYIAVLKQGSTMRVLSCIVTCQSVPVSWQLHGQIAVGVQSKKYDGK